MIKCLNNQFWLNLGKMYQNIIWDIYWIYRYVYFYSIICSTIKAQSFKNNYQSIVIWHVLISYFFNLHLVLTKSWHWRLNSFKLMNIQNGLCVLGVFHLHYGTSCFSMIELRHNGLCLIACLIFINLLAILVRNDDSPEIHICQPASNVLIDIYIFLNGNSEITAVLFN